MESVEIIRNPGANPCIAEGRMLTDGGFFCLSYVIERLERRGMASPGQLLLLWDMQVLNFGLSSVVPSLFLVNLSFLAGQFIQRQNDWTKQL
jgi:hypothetical protein